MNFKQKLCYRNEKKTNSYNLIRSRLVTANATVVSTIKAQRCEDRKGKNTDCTKGAGRSHLAD